MSRIMSSLLLGILMLAAMPLAAYGEENDKPRSGLLKGTASALGTTLESVGKTVGKTLEATGGTVEKVVSETAEGVTKTVGDTVEFTEETVSDLSRPLSSKPVTSTVKRTTELLGDTVDNTLPIAETAVEGVNETVGTVTSETVDTVHTSVGAVTEALPEIPVVTPVVDEVHNSAKELTGVVQTTVEGTGHVLEGTVNGVSETVKGTVKGTGKVVEETVDAAVKPLQPERQEESASPEEETAEEEATQQPAPPVEQGEEQLAGGNQQDQQAAEPEKRPADNPVQPAKDQTGKPALGNPEKNRPGKVNLPLVPIEEAEVEADSPSPAPDKSESEDTGQLATEVQTTPAPAMMTEEARLKPEGKKDRPALVKKAAETPPVPAVPAENGKKADAPQAVISQPTVQQSGMSISGSKAPQWGNSGVLLDLYHRFDAGNPAWVWADENAMQLWKPPALQKPPRPAPFFIS